MIKSEGLGVTQNEVQIAAQPLVKTGLSQVFFFFSFNKFQFLSITHHEHDYTEVLIRSKWNKS